MESTSQLGSVGILTIQCHNSWNTVSSSFIRPLLQQCFAAFSNEPDTYFIKSILNYLISMLMKCISFILYIYLVSTTLLTLLFNSLRGSSDILGFYCRITWFALSFFSDIFILYSFFLPHGSSYCLKRTFKIKDDLVTFVVLKILWKVYRLCTEGKCKGYRKNSKRIWKFRKGHTHSRDF